METGTNILSYKGDAALGGAGLPTTSAAGLDTINDTAKSIMLQNHANNLEVFKQKVADRDTMLGLLAQGQIQSGAIDEKDRPAYDKAQKEVNDTFDEMVKNGGIRNKELYGKYLSKVKDLQNTTTQAQGRDLMLTKLRAERAAEKNPEKQKAYDKFIEGQESKPFWSMIDPYQQQTDLDILGAYGRASKDAWNSTGGISQPTSTSTSTSTKQVSGKQPVTTTTTKTGQVKGKGAEPIISGTPSGGASQQGTGSSSTMVFSGGLPYHVSTDVYDFGQVRKNTARDWLEESGDGHEQQRLLLDEVGNKTDPTRNKNFVHNIIDKADQYNKERGFIPQTDPRTGKKVFTQQQIDAGAAQTDGKFDLVDFKTGQLLDPNNPQDVNNPNAKYVIKTTADDFTALATLANEKDFVKHSYSLAKDEEQLLLQKEKIDSEAFRNRMLGGAAATKARAYAANLHSQIQARTSKIEKEKFVDDLYTRNFLGQQPLSKEVGFVNRIDARNSVPILVPHGKEVGLLIPLDSKPVYKDSDYDAKGKLKPNVKPVRYDGGYYDVEYTQKSGRIIDNATLVQNYAKWKQTYNNLPPEKQAQVQPFNSFDDFVKYNVESGTIDYKLRGANGSVDRGLFQSGQMQLSDQVTKKGEADIWNVDEPPTDEQPQDESSSTTSYEKITDKSVSD